MFKEAEIMVLLTFLTIKMFATFLKAIAESETTYLDIFKSHNADLKA